MTRKSEIPQTTHHVAIFDEDWEYITTNFGSGPHGQSPGVVVKMLVHRYVKELKAKAQARIDRRGG